MPGGYCAFFADLPLNCNEPLDSYVVNLLKQAKASHQSSVTTITAIARGVAVENPQEQ